MRSIGNNGPHFLYKSLFLQFLEIPPKHTKELSSNHSKRDRLAIKSEDGEERDGAQRMDACALQTKTGQLTGCDTSESFDLQTVISPLSSRELIHEMNKSGNIFDVATIVN